MKLAVLSLSKAAAGWGQYPTLQVMCIYVYIYISHIRMYIHTCAYMHMYICVWIHMIDVYLFTYIHIYICMYIYMCIYIYVYIEHAGAMLWMDIRRPIQGLCAGPSSYPFKRSKSISFKSTVQVAHCRRKSISILPEAFALMRFQDRKTAI